jgi:hypothetical protein
MSRRSLTLLAGLALALCAGAAAARDYVVVASSDPALVRGQALDAGARVPLGPGQTLTVMHASGSVVRLKGAAGGIVLPRRMANQADADRLAILKVMVAPPARQTVPTTRTRGGVGLCPEAASLTTLDAIAQARTGGCREVAGQALEAWIAAQPEVEEP